MVSMRIELSEGWLKFVRSQAMVFMTALTCLSLTFAPMALFRLGKAGADYRDPRVIACFAVIVLVPLVYLRLATLFIQQLRKASIDSIQSVSQGSSISVGSLLPWVVVIVGAVAIYLLLRP
jgi:hypothetical protein